MSLIDQPEKAMRLARAIASDIALYNAEKIKEGLENDTLFDSLSSELAEGEELYSRRVAPDLQGGASYYWQAVVDIIVRTAEQLETPLLSAA